MTSPPYNVVHAAAVAHGLQLVAARRAVLHVVGDRYALYDQGRCIATAGSLSAVYAFLESLRAPVPADCST